MKITKNNLGFGAVGLIIIALVIAIIGSASYIVWDKNNKDGSSVINQTAETNIVPSTQQADSNEGFLIVKEWGLRFKVPSGLKDVQYKITGETLAFYAKPIGLNADYVNGYDKVDSFGYPSLAIGVVYRSKDGVKDKIGDPVNGKKLGEYFYYTAWSFSGLATGSACLPLYDMPNQELQCAEENKAFELVNRTDGSLLSSIGLIQ